MYTYFSLSLSLYRPVILHTHAHTRCCSTLSPPCHRGRSITGGPENINQPPTCTVYAVTPAVASAYANTTVRPDIGARIRRRGVVHHHHHRRRRREDETRVKFYTHFSQKPPPLSICIVPRRCVATATR